MNSIIFLVFFPISIVISVRRTNLSNSSEIIGKSRTRFGRYTRFLPRLLNKRVWFFFNCILALSELSKYKININERSVWIRLSMIFSILSVLLFQVIVRRWKSINFTFMLELPWENGSSSVEINFFNVSNFFWTKINKIDRRVIKNIRPRLWTFLNVLLKWLSFGDDLVRFSTFVLLVQLVLNSHYFVFSQLLVVADNIERMAKIVM